MLNPPRRTLLHLRQMPRALVRVLVVFGFGFLLPSALLFQAYTVMNRMDVGISAAVTPKLSDILPERAGKPVDAHDYAMAALIFVETSNRAVMVSKQQMKLAVMHIGFAVISIGLTLIALGIDAGGIDVTGQSPDSKYSVSLKVASTGVLVFVIGAGMATIGGIMKTEYQTLSTPSFSDGESVPAANVDSKKARRLAAMPPAIDWCRKNVPTPASKLDECLADAVRELSQ